MDAQILAAYTKQLEWRAKMDLALPPTPLLRQTYIGYDGVERPLKIRVYQSQAVLHLIQMARFVLGDDTGLGKSLISIAALCYLWAKAPDMKVVVLTTKSATKQWAAEFARFTTGVRVITCRGDPRVRAAARERFEKATGPTVFIIGYRAAVQDFSHLQGWSGYLLVTDEATAYKTPSTQVHKCVAWLGAQAQRVWALTATLIKNHLLEGYGIYRVVVPGLFGSKTSFMNTYCIVRMQRIPRSNRQIPVIVGYHPEGVKKFKELIAPYFLGRPKHQVAKDLPVLTTKTVKVGLTQEQQDKYDEALSGLLAIKGGQELKPTDKLTQIIYCQQIVNHLGLLDCAGDSEKLDALMDLLSDEGDFAEDKVIVFTRFKKMVDLLMPVLDKAGIKAVRITGAENDTQRQAAQDAFQDPNSDTRVVCITTAGSEAINLQAAKAVICFDSPWSAGDYLQILGRMIRIGSVHDRVYAVHLVAEDTVDENVMEVLGKKMVLVEAIIGKRLKGEKDAEEPIFVESEIDDLFTSLRDSARKKAGVA